MFGLQGPEGYTYTNRSNCLEVEGIDDSADWAETLVSHYSSKPISLTSTQKAMNVIGLDSEEQYAILRMLAIILWLGNVQFEEQDDGNAKISDTGVSDFIAYLMETEAALVEKVLTTRTVETQRGGRRGKPYTSHI
jgi:myosin-1